MAFRFILGAVLATVGGFGVGLDKKVEQAKKQSQLARCGRFWLWLITALAGCALLTTVIF